MEQQQAPDAGHGAAEWSKRRRLRSALVTLAVVCFLLVGFRTLLTSPQRITQLEIVGWRIYHDPLGLFTMRLPPGWKASSSLGSFTEGNRTESTSGQDENVRFSNPALGAASASIFVYAQQINNPAVARSMWCSLRSGQSSTFNGGRKLSCPDPLQLSRCAFPDRRDDSWVTCACQSRRPGQSATSTATAATVTSDYSLLSDALAAFQPTNPHPLNCPCATGL